MSERVRLPGVVLRCLPWLMGLLFLSLLVSQSAMDLLFFAVSVCGFVVFVRSARVGQVRRDFSLGWLDWFVLIFVLTALVGLAVSEAPSEVLWFQIGELRWIFVLYLLVGFFRSYGAELPRHWLWTAWWILLAVSVVELGIYFIASGSGLWVKRLGGFHDNSMTHAHLFAVSGFFLAGYWLRHWDELSRNRRMVLAVGAFVAGLSLLFSLTRGVWLAATFSAVALAFVKSRRWGLGVAVGIATLALGLVLTVPQIQKRVLMVTNYEQNYDSERVLLYKVNWQIFLDSPIVGIGYNENRRRLREYYDQLGVRAGQFESHAHNQVLHLLAGVGALGAGSFLFLFVGTLVRVWRNRDHPYRWAVAASLLCFLLGGLTEANFEHWKMKYALVLVLALALSFETVPQGSKDS